MRRTSVMIEIEDDVYNGIVEPHKRNKTFAKLISSLLNGYISDGYIRAFVDDNLEEVRKAVVGSFEDSVGEMESALANMGLFADELGAHAQAGYAKFQQKRTQQAEELDSEPVVSSRQSDKPKQESPDVTQLNNKVNDLERNMTEGFNRILEMLGNMASGGVMPVTGNHEVKPAVHGRAEDLIIEKALGISAPESLVPTAKAPVVREPARKEPVVLALNRQGSGNDDTNDAEESEGVEESVANSFLANLMSDFGSSF